MVSFAQPVTNIAASRGTAPHLSLFFVIVVYVLVPLFSHLQRFTLRISGCKDTFYPRNKKAYIEYC